MKQLDNIDDFSSKLILSHREKLSTTVYKTLARHIYSKVRDARRDPDSSSMRWPFELIQNAHDAGQREGSEGITVEFRLIDGILYFEHDAAPFTISDITALIIGGSSKDFHSFETTGRFGTGFLVTHVLSEQVRVNGILQEEGALRAIEVMLDRPDDEELILQNIRDTESAFGQTQAVADFANKPTVSVEYTLDNNDSALIGLNMLEQALPHLFGSCPRLQKVIIQREDRKAIWRTASRAEPFEHNEVLIQEFEVYSTNEDGEESEWRVIKAALTLAARGWLLAALRRDNEKWSLSKPGQLPSVFRQLPVLGGPTLPGWVIIDGKFDLDQERSSVHVVGEYAYPLREAFAALGGLANFAIREEWANGYRVAQLAMPTESLGDAASQVWREVLSSTAINLAQQPLVNTFRLGMLPAIQTESHDHWVDFIKRPSAGPSHSELWILASACKGLDLPAQSDSEGWTEIAEGWESLGVKVNWVNLQLIGKQASSESDEVIGLAVDGDPYHWIAEYLDLVGRTWKANGIVKSYVERLLPDQHGKLRNYGELRREGGITERVKAIAAKVGIDFKAQLLNTLLFEMLVGENLAAGIDALKESTGEEFTEEEGISSLIEHLEKALPADRPISEAARPGAAATIDLLEHLWESRGSEARNTAWQVPVLAADGTARRAGHRRLMVLPIPKWPEVARPFASAYPPSRLLSDDYAAAAGCDVLLEALTTWGIAHRGLVEVGQREELRDRGLRAIAIEPEDVIDASLREAKFMQIALLEPEVINYCKQSRERAQALLGLVVCYVAPADQSWRSTVELSVHTPARERQVHLTPSLWLADLRSKPWIPCENEQDITHHVPNPELLRELLVPQWLEGNSHGADLLVQHFDMDALDVRLLAVAQDEAARQQLRDKLARIVAVVNDNPQAITDLLAKVERTKRDVERMRNLGLAVQGSVEIALKKLRLDIDVIDHGYDFLVSAVKLREDDPEDLSAQFEIDKYKLEVKTTTTGEVRLTPLQAATAVQDPDSFVLCVVDLRNFKGDVHQVNWTTTDVSARCRLVSGQNLPIYDTLTYVQIAEGSDVPIRNATALRYAVSSNLWESGMTLDEWVQNAFATRDAST